MPSVAAARRRSAQGMGEPLPRPFLDWFTRRGWEPRPHQTALLSKLRERRSTLLIAPTGAGKTLAGFLPSLVALSSGRHEPGRLHTLYISPLKALAVDVARNLGAPIEEMGLPVRVETRTGDTPPSRRRRQRLKPPQILMTTPEQLALLLGGDDHAHLLQSVDTVILDELHALAPSKRGDLLALGLARLRAIAPALASIGLSATVARPSELRAFLVPQTAPATTTLLSDLIELKGGARPEIAILEGDDPLPWSGHTALYALKRIYAAIAAHRLSLVFVNTRMQAELLFHELWRMNEDTLPIALHHGSLDVGQRRKVEAAMAAGRLRAVVATSTLDLGIDWGDVDLVINVGAPKGASRFIQRVGRANHRLDEPSRALLVPSNRFEVLECRAAHDAALAGAQDAVLNRRGALDVLAQHVLGTAAGGPFHPDALYREVVSAQPYAHLTRRDFDRAVDLVSTGGYALRSYERFARLRPVGDGRLRVAHPSIGQLWRLNVGTIVESPMLKVRLVGARSMAREARRAAARSSGRSASMSGRAGGRVLGEIDEWFIGELSPGDTFVFGGEIVRFEGVHETEAYVTRTTSRDPMVPSYPGGKFPLSTHLAERVRRMLAHPTAWSGLPAPVVEWLEAQQRRSRIPAADEVLIETFPQGGRHYVAVYPFEGRLAHQSLGMLLTRRLDRAGAEPLGFLANDYALAVWGLGDLSALIAGGRLDLAALLDEDMLGDDLEAWLASSSLMKRTFRMCAIIAGLVERRHPGQEKSGRQLMASSDLLYDVLQRHEPGHVLLEAARQDAATGLLDIARLGAFLRRIRGRIVHSALERASPLAVPLLLEMGRERIGGSGPEGLLRQAAEALIEEAMESI